MSNNPLRLLETLGQSVWLDFLRRGMLTNGDLKRLIDDDGLSGITSNPTIFEQAIVETHDYDAAIETLVHAGRPPQEIYEAFAIEDVQHAADMLRPTYDRTGGRDGFVSLEVSPHLADDTPGTVAEARRLWAALHRPNVFIKVPGTRAGLPAIRDLLRDGINVNVTLLFALERYREVTEAWLAGLEARRAAGQPLAHVASVASFFLSRIDVLVDKKLDQLVQAGGPQAPRARGLRGQVALACAKLAYPIYREIVSGERFRKLAASGALPQRLLWASTGTKDPSYSDVKYIEPLIGPDTINTMPLETLTRYRDHGRPAARLEQEVPSARRVLDELREVGIDLAAVTQELEAEGVQKFNQPFDKLLQTLAQKGEALHAGAGRA